MLRFDDVAGRACLERLELLDDRRSGLVEVVRFGGRGGGEVGDDTNGAPFSAGDASNE